MCVSSIHHKGVYSIMGVRNGPIRPYKVSAERPIITNVTSRLYPKIFITSNKYITINWPTIFMLDYK